MTVVFDCMTEAELEAWREAAARVIQGAQDPCADCPMAWHLAMKAERRCHSRPYPNGGRRPARTP